MVYDAEKGDPFLSGSGDERVTSIGRFLRKYRLDEIPNFINVLKGEMSIVGPRPERLFFINQIIKSAPQYFELHKVKPGITSWGQVKYGYASNVGEMVERLDYDLFYLKNRSAWFDLKIIFLTIGTVLRGRGI
jgi:lipopolysaccharide/colanic/teichoic acid biosynthesis glycosyltransferase